MSHSSPRPPSRGPSMAPDAAAAGAEQAQRPKRPRESRLGPGSGAGATVEGIQRQANSRRCVNPAAPEPGPMSSSRTRSGTMAPDAAEDRCAHGAAPRRGQRRQPRIEGPLRKCHGMSCSVMGRPAVPDAPPPEERSSRAHNARPVARAPARAMRRGRPLHRGCHEMSCSVMCAAGNVMFCHAVPLPPGCRRGPPAGLRRGLRRRGSVSVMRASFQAKQRAGRCPCFARVSRGGACACAGGRIAAARLARLIARARRRAHLARPFPPGCFSRPPAIAFCRKAERRPRKPPLYFHSTPYR